MLFVIAVNAASNNGLSLAAYPLVLSTIAGINLLDKTISIESFKINVFLLRLFLYLASLFLVFSMGYYRITAVYRDANLPILTTTLRGGPANGIQTTSDSAEKYLKVIDDLSHVNRMSDSSTIFITKLLPFGYLFLEKSAATPNLWRTSLNAHELISYYSRYPDHIPNTIIIINQNIGITNENNPFGGFFNEAMLLQKYVETKMETLTIFEKNDS